MKTKIIKFFKNIDKQFRLYFKLKYDLCENEICSLLDTMNDGILLYGSDYTESLNYAILNNRLSWVKFKREFYSVFL